jgi:selenocysteine lyase/cysteine desulfurase
VKNKVRNVILFSIHRDVWTSEVNSRNGRGEQEHMNSIEPLVDLRKYRQPAGGGIYLNTPFTGLPWISYREAEERYLDVRLSGMASVTPSTSLADEGQQLRRLLGEMVECTSEEVAFAFNTTHALNTLIGCMKSEMQRGDSVVVPGGIYLSVALAAEPLKKLGVEVHLCESETEAIIEAIYRRKPKLVLIESLNYRTGALYDVEKISAAAHDPSIKARIIVDVSQTLGVIPQRLAPFDAMVATGYKWLSGDHGLAPAFVNLDRWPNPKPDVMGWHSVEDIDWPYMGTYQFRANAQLLEAGGNGWKGVFVLRDSAENLKDVDAQKRMWHSRSLGSEYIAGLKALDLGLTILTPEDPTKRAGYVTVNMTDAKAKELCLRLSARNISTSSGKRRWRVGHWNHNGTSDNRRLLEVLPEVLIGEMDYDPQRSPHDPAWVG